MVWHSRAHAPAGAVLSALLTAALAVSSDAPPSTPDLDEAAEWNTAWEDLAVQPITVRAGTVGRLPGLPGSQDSLTQHLAASGLPLPTEVRPYIRQEGRSRLLWRTRMVLPDPTDPNPWRRAATYGRLLASTGECWNGGLVIERDGGEPGFADYASGTLGYRSADGREHFVVGHVRAHVGTGLLTSRMSAFWVDLSAIRPRGTSLSPALAATESGELFGVAGLVRRNTWEALLLAVRPRWDATVDDAGIVTTLRTQGIHVTDAERRARGRLTERYFLAHIGWSPLGAIDLGASAARSQFNLPTRLTLTASAPVNDQMLTGLDVHVQRKPLDVWGEVVRDARGPVGMVGAATYEFYPASLVAAAWSYDPGLVLPHGVGWSFRNEPIDERAAFVGVRWRQGRFGAEAIGARYRQEHASRIDSLPETGTWEEVRATYSLTSRTSLRARWRQRSEDRPSRGSGLEALRTEVRGEVAWERDWWEFAWRADRVVARPYGSGTLIALSCTRRRSERFHLSAQLAAFRSTTSGAALYLYEVRAPGYGAIAMLTGTGLASFGRIGGTVYGVDWSLAAHCVTHRSREAHLTLTAQIEYGFL